MAKAKFGWKWADIRETFGAALLVGIEDGGVRIDRAVDGDRGRDYYYLTSESKVGRSTRVRRRHHGQG